MSFKVNISDKAKLVLLDLLMDQSTETQHMVKDMMGEAFEQWLIEKLGKQLEEAVEETTEEKSEAVPLDPAESSG